ncbi:MULTISPECIES: YchJ family protein [unclassified Pseudoalteromonas]|uniref:YchJ family protein n=1 Tax=unclassified Pseudoalteromonas TaxID=194690 RepID=UPI001305075D|nr:MULTISPECIES: YchJ family protein [unclassified Pseudoalteromonas]MCF2829642.1 YchJ family protein [Pseudoalteromonas sp. OF5H-5]MCF2834623.1 YchJ family protein [Pseudoalteromonas sp. DL2-H6]MCF2927438.1 YchJ family protein [Pseudoalteromonas sp. DL2-H1]MCF7516405.1 YchJ family protein [Pseudoalteromonas sp. L7]MCF7528467.1 YchJ family protein [Pseudoalteromonas sp. L23]
MSCYCNSSLPYSQCCEPYLKGQKFAERPQILMRSRYTAYCLKDAKYIHDTYAQAKQAQNNIDDIAAFANYAHFIKLEVLEEVVEATQGIVEFKAHYIAENTHYILHERSNFITEAGRWYYLDGELYDTPTTKVGRNDLCPCGSDKKYKKCHGS